MPNRYDRFRAEIALENDAFADDCGSELARILRKLVDRIERDVENGDSTLYDINGNLVGEASLQEAR